MILLVSGSRLITDYNIFKRAVHQWAQNYHKEKTYPLPLNSWITGIVSGHAKGVDTLAEKFAAEQGIDSIIFPANWKKNGKAAGPIRNTQMLEYGELVGAKHLLALPYPKAVGGGTNHMISICKRHNVEVFIYDVSTDPRWQEISVENS